MPFPGLGWRRMQLVGWALATVLFIGGVQAKNPRDGDPAAIQAGGTLFRERCADCHGANAKGVSGPDLTRLWTTEASGERVFRMIRSGVPGSIMPSSPAPDAELWAIVAYLRNISTAKSEESSGNVANGAQILAANCLSCHRVNDAGGRLGPDLSRLAASQTNQVLTRAVRDASAAFTSGYETVTLVTRDGQQIRGTLASGVGSSNSSRQASPACSRQRPASCSTATTKLILWRSTHAPERACGSTRPVRRYG